MNKTALCILAIASLAFAACSNVRTSTIRLAGSERLPESVPDEVEIYLSEKDVPGNFRKIALIYAEEGNYNIGPPKMGALIGRMRKRAARLGANGLILGDTEKELSISGGGDKPIDINTDKTIKGLAIYVEK